ncbi:hypothetical protein [Solilutibacter silvestris]|uniref:hypothetical protein n=1 Tax=Solilutibacter silvestris TaxID=1645665 RepID=UPI003D331F5B
MNPVDPETYRLAVRKWQRADPSQRLVRTTRDDRGRTVRELVSYGVVRVRMVEVGGGMAEVYTDTCRRFREPDPGRISFKTWQPLEVTYGTAKRVVPIR